MALVATEMSRRLVIRPQARLELAAASDWYDAQDNRLADKFLHTFAAALEKVLQNPLQYQKIHGGARRANIGRFPHGLIYRISGEEVVVISCFHGRRNPERWQGRAR